MYRVNQDPLEQKIRQRKLELESRYSRGYETNAILLEASKETMRHARQVCSLWDSRTASLELDTKSLIHSIPEAKEVYQGVAP